MLLVLNIYPITLNTHTATLSSVGAHGVQVWAVLLRSNYMALGEMSRHVLFLMVR